MNKLHSIFGGFIAILTLASCSDLCGEEIIVSIPSPSNDYQATIYIRDCGATTDYATHIKMKQGSKQEIIFVQKGWNDDIELSWKSDTVLEIETHNGEGAYVQKKDFMEVDVVYKN